MGSDEEVKKVGTYAITSLLLIFIASGYKGGRRDQEAT